MTLPVTAITGSIKDKTGPVWTLHHTVIQLSLKFNLFYVDIGQNNEMGIITDGIMQIPDMSRWVT